MAAPSPEEPTPSKPGSRSPRSPRAPRAPRRRLAGSTGRRPLQLQAQVRAFLSRVAAEARKQVASRGRGLRCGDGVAVAGNPAAGALAGGCCCREGVAERTTASGVLGSRRAPRGRRGLLLSPAGLLVATPLPPGAPLPALHGRGVVGSLPLGVIKSDRRGASLTATATSEATSGPGRRGSLGEALGAAVSIAQAFGVMPVGGSPRSRRLRTLVLTTLALAVAALSASHAFQAGGANLTSLSPLLFYGTAAMSVHLLSRLSSRWPRLESRWHCLGGQGALLTVGVDGGADDARVCRAITLSMLTGALVEHSFGLLNALVPLLACRDEGGAWSVYKTFFVNKFPMVFGALPFSVPASLLLLYLNLTCAFAWNLVDVVVVIVSYLLAVKFKRFNSFLESAKGKDYSAFWWQEVRQSYSRLSALAKHVDAHISSLVLLSFASNLYFIALQLLHNMTKYSDSDAPSRVYYYSSLAWLLLRAALVSMTASSVYEQSLCPVEVLYCVPSKSFCVEVQRFLIQTTTDTVALSGCRFFWVTRSLVLTLAGTVATYEIVLVQFYSEEEKYQNATEACLV